METEPLPVEQRLARRKREPEAVTAEAPDGDGGARGAEAPEEAKVGGAHGQGAPEEEKDDDDDDDDDENGDDRAEDTSSGGGGAITVVAARYDASPFSSCSAPCGPSGLRQRAVRCVDNESGAQLPLAACEDLGPPPPPQEVCNHVDCPPAWEWPPWTGIKCSRACGGGDKWRQARCSQRLADGQDVTLEASRCAHLGPGEERRGCHRAACRSRLRQGELLRLDCLAANATWRHNGSALDVRQDDKYLADHDSGMLLVYSVEPRDAGQYLCDEEDGGVKSTHRFEVTVLPPTTPFSGDDDLFVRVWDVTTENGEFTTEAAPALTRAETTVGEVDGGVDGVEDVEELQTTAPAPGPPFPWHRLFGPAAPLRGRVIGIFS
ncbi:ADAMTS-like protein 1 [Frankliniella fusca]|uniref:ADAMTS-like protein 1 n=1 Tax=Frankliniella fusca TaxID=407009 RepID=A0AAE1HHC9_9NEOP|nr:ADAMTS-like protein 1 [Frankliniella fusca]